MKSEENNPFDEIGGKYLFDNIKGNRICSMKSVKIIST